MSWFSEQIETRKHADEASFESALRDIADSINRRYGLDMFTDPNQQISHALAAVLGFYRIRVSKQDAEDDREQNIINKLKRMMKVSGVEYRMVGLRADFYRTAIAPMIVVTKEDRRVVALIPSSFGGYHFTDENGRRHRVDAKIASGFEEQAYTFYKPFPEHSLKARDVLLYIVSVLNVGDFISVILAFTGVTAMGLFVPRITALLFSEVLKTGSVQMLISLTVFFLCVTISGAMLDIIKQLLMSRISVKIDSSLEAATMIRLLSLPVSFFKEFNTGNLSSRVSQISSLASMIVDLTISTGLTVVFSAVYVWQVFFYAPALVLPVLVVLTVQLLISILMTRAGRKQSAKELEYEAQESGKAFPILSGIQKIRLIGAEKRMFALWAKSFARRAAVTYNPPLILRTGAALSTAAGAFGTIFFYGAAIESGVTTAGYYAFTAAYSMVSAAFALLATAMQESAGISSVIGNVAPVLEAVPESGDKRVLTNPLQGDIELSHVTFSYDESDYPVINDFSLKIKAGQYVAIVGRSGCGKSTLIRLLVGFETPQKGAIYYDGHNIASIDMREARKQIGLILQDGKLLHDDIYSNIVLSNPGLGMDAAWEAAEKAQIAEDIRNLPMQMHTLIGEGNAGISGGQKQRLLIARAVAGNPRVLIFDEATSALDNITQHKISETLDRQKATRIVVAHRLSTIRLCDRIIVMNEGRICEDGTYEELMQKQGMFAELVARQQIDEA